MSATMYNQFRQTVKHLIDNIRYPKRILVVRQDNHQSTYNDYFLYWVSQYYPEAAKLFEVHYLPCKITNWDRYSLFLPWLQDPLKERFPHIYTYAKELEGECIKYNIPIINPVDKLSNSVKSVALQIIGTVGIRTAQTVAITEPEYFKKTLGGLTTPFFIRDNWIHGSKTYFIEHLNQVQNISFEEFVAPLAMEFIDTKGDDDLYRKYRYYAIGDLGIPGPFMSSKFWEVRHDNRFISEATIAEEIAYFSGEDPNHQILQQARKALGFDFVAFDYSYDRKGNIVVWEPNPFPVIWGLNDDRPEKAYQKPSIHRIYTAILKFYLQYAQIPVKMPILTSKS